jgi:hypothetical protein
MVSSQLHAPGAFIFIIIIIMAVQPFVELWPIFQFLDPIRSR